MAEQKKTSDAQLRATKNYLHNSVEDIKVRVPKGYKAMIKQHAEKCGQSINDFICDLICKECGLAYTSKKKTSESVNDN